MNNQHPNIYLNEMVAFHVLHYLAKLDFQKTGSTMNNSSWSFLKRTGINPDTDPSKLDGVWLGNEAATLQRQLVSIGGPNLSLRSVIRHYKRLLPLVAHGPQAWLIKTYDSMLKNVYELDLGIKKYGRDKDVYRDIVDNVKAARLMFEEASRKIADKIYLLYGDHPALALVEGGAGNGAAMLTNLERFPRSALPKFLLTDIDEKTRLPAEKLFLSKGFTGNLPWIKVDLGNVSDILKIKRTMMDYHLVFSVNFIIHEHVAILENFFRAIRHGLPDAQLVISEFFLPENEDLIGPDFPWWFVYLHEISGQHLRTEKDFMVLAKSYGYTVFDRLDHPLVNQKPLTSTLFLSK